MKSHDGQLFGGGIYTIEELQEMGVDPEYIYNQLEHGEFIDMEDQLSEEPE